MSVPLGRTQPAPLCILRAGDSLLLLERHGDPDRGMYAPGGGTSCPFESPRDAAVRETPAPVTDRVVCRCLLEGTPCMCSAGYDAGLTLREVREEIEGALVSTNAQDMRRPQGERSGA